MTALMHMRTRPQKPTVRMSWGEGAVFMSCARSGVRSRGRGSSADCRENTLEWQTGASVNQTITSGYQTSTLEHWTSTLGYRTSTLGSQKIASEYWTGTFGKRTDGFEYWERIFERSSSG